MTMAISGSALQIAPIARHIPTYSDAETENRPIISRAASDSPPPPDSAGPRSSSPGSFSRFSRRNRWPLSIGVSALLHIGVAGAMMAHWSFSQTAPTAPPPAAMIVELAAMPSSPPVTPSEVPPGPEQVEAAPKPTPVDKMNFDAPPLADPALRPDFVLPKKEQVKPSDTQQVAEAARQTTAPPSVPSPEEDKNAAPVEGNNSAPPSDAEQGWEGRLLAKLERNKRYPAAAQRAGQQDTVFLRLVMDRKGKLLDAALRQNAGFALINAETLALAKRASPFPPPPANIPGDRIVRIVPVKFYITNSR